MESDVGVLIVENINTLIVDIISTGNTIAEEEQEKLFDAFTRESTSQNITESGLGLRIVKKKLEYHGAEVDYSIPKKAKNKFTITFNTYYFSTTHFFKHIW